MAKHRCKVPDPPVDTGRWLGTYGDMVTLLMAFFVMLFAVSDTSSKKFEAFLAGLAGPFDNQSLTLGVLSGEHLDVALDPLDLIAPVEVFEHTQSTVTDALDPSTAEAQQDLSQAQRQLDEIEARIEAVLAATAVPISADIRDDERGLVVAISTDEVLFATGSAELSPDGRALIGEIAPVLRDAPNTVVIEGHTDDQPLNRAGYSNWNLSTDRAVAVVELLGETLGVPFDRISAAGYGEHRPLVPNDAPANRAKNRRVEILIVAIDRHPGTGVPSASDVLTAAAPQPAPATPGASAAGAPPAVLDFSESLPSPPGGTPLASIIGR